MDGMTSVLIVDDDPLVRAGLALILGGSDELEVVGEAEDGEQALALVAEHRPDVVLMDIRMPRLNGIEATERLRATDDPPEVIVLTTFDADDYVIRALGAGASGFLLKDTAPPDIVEAVRRVAAGSPMLSPSVTAQLIRQVAGSGRSSRASVAKERIAALTERETEVAIAVGRGWSNAEIAKRLYLSVPTVKAHISQLFTKLQVTNRVQVAICVHDAELV